MPSLPLLSSTPETTKDTHHVSTTNQYREAAYHQDSQGRYVAQSYRVQRPLDPSSPVLESNTKLVKRPRRSLRSQRTVLLELSSSKMTSWSSNVDLSREDHQQPSSALKPRRTETSTSLIPPSAPRPRRLATPELSDIEDERQFCGCDCKRNACKCCTSCL